MKQFAELELAACEQELDIQLKKIADQYEKA